MTIIAFSNAAIGNNNMDSNKEYFAQKHKILNLLFSLGILVVITILIVWIIKFIFNIILEGLGKLASVASNLDAVIIVALITGGASLIGVIISSIISKIIDYKKSRKEYLSQKREKPYGEFVDMIYKVQKNIKQPESYSNEEMQSDLSKFSKQITLWGSSGVINRWIQFRENSSNPKNATENLFLMEEIMNEMRKDLGLKRVKKGNLLGFFVNDIKSAIKNKRK